jgi:hypothetical protein
MTYNYPTEERIREAIKCGWSKERAERGFDIFECEGTGLLFVDLINQCHYGTDMTARLAAQEAERIGFCKIIPIDELPINFDMRKEYYWVDTPRNRAMIKKYCGK